MKAAQEFLKSLREHFANDADAHAAAMEVEEPDSSRHAFHKSRQAASATWLTSATNSPAHW